MSRRLSQTPGCLVRDQRGKFRRRGRNLARPRSPFHHVVATTTPEELRRARPRTVAALVCTKGCFRTHGPNHCARRSRFEPARREGVMNVVVLVQRGDRKAGRQSALSAGDVVTAFVHPISSACP